MRKLKKRKILDSVRGTLVVTGARAGNITVLGKSKLGSLLRATKAAFGSLEETRDFEDLTSFIKMYIKGPPEEKKIQTNIEQRFVFHLVYQRRASSDFRPSPTS
jgi:hypothetical protein